MNLNGNRANVTVTEVRSDHGGMVVTAIARVSNDKDPHGSEIGVATNIGGLLLAIATAGEFDSVRFILDDLTRSSL